VTDTEESEAANIVSEAVGKGITYFDVAPSYGNAEEKLGPALRPHRDGVFLACKTAERTKDKAAAQMRRSLELLKTDHFDLYQLHGLTSVEEVQMCFGPGGAMEAVVEAQQAGLIRYIGFSAHDEAAAILCLETFPFNSVLFPTNYITWNESDFGPSVLKVAEAKGAARLALKAMARRPWPEDSHREYPKCWYEPFDDLKEASEALRWTLSMPITAALPPGDARLLRLALQIVESFTPLTEAERLKIEAGSSQHQPIFTKAA